MMGREEQLWTMFAAAALAGGKSVKDSLKSADQMSAAVKARFKPEEDED